ncbi:hypothetical protein HSBAA_19130 [Vreelandella sulfidaeris]|uniref:Polysaccharide chain length determinant N-terminal domain-containing protein n=1 Tax=Vreelandella sulfidaeris TaxID=115553 RepID=A0A455U4Y7_9GAMM|nr:hypothetical protein HSBAA_19130 [Halomonas sulfidaeris]
MVDLAKILVKRWKAMVLVFLVIVLGALAYVLLTERSYEYVSIYQVVEEAPGRALETPASVLAKVNSLYIGSETRKLRESAGLESLPFEVTADNPSDTLLVRLYSEASTHNHELVAQMHEALLSRMMEEQGDRLERQQAALEQQLQNTEATLESVAQTSTEWGSELAASYTERLADIRQDLTQLSEGEVVQVSVQSLEPAGTGRSLIMILALVFGGIAGIMMAFFAELVCRVRESLDAESK